MDREGASRSLDEEDLGVWEGGLGGKERKFRGGRLEICGMDPACNLWGVCFLKGVT